MKPLYRDTFTCVRLLPTDYRGFTLLTYGLKGALSVNLKSIFSTVLSFARERTELVLTGIAVSGVLTTAYLSAQGALRADWEIQDFFEDTGSEEIVILTRYERFQMTWKHYTPAVLSAAITIASIVGSQKINSKKQAALAAGYAIAEKTLVQYREEIAELLGDKKVQEITDRIADKQIASNPVTKNEVIVTGYGDQLCFEALTGRYFTSSAEKIRRSENEFNKALLSDTYASLNDFYDLVGLPRTDLGDDLGWRSEELMNLSLSSHLTNDDRTALSIHYNSTPGPKYYRGHI